MAWSAELKAKMLKYAKRKRGVLLKDVDPNALPVFAVDHFDDCGLSEAGERTWSMSGKPKYRQWAYLSRATAEQVAALTEHLPNRRVMIGSRIGPRPVTVFNYARLKHAPLAHEPD